MINKKIVNIKNKSIEIQKETTEKISFYILSGLGVVAALSWNETIQTLINLIPIEKNSIIAKVIYSITITIVLVITTITFSKIKRVDDKKIRTKNKK